MFVFLITSNASSVSLSDGHMGLPQFDLASQDSFFAVEFDTSFDLSVGDFNGNHVGVDVNSVVSIVSVDVKSKGVDLKSGKKITAWIEYRDSAKLVQIWVSYSSMKPRRLVLVAQLDLSNQFTEYMHVGFSASNGRGSAMHFVEHWRFKTFGNCQPMVDRINGTCSTCSRDDSLKNRPRKRSLDKICYNGVSQEPNIGKGGSAVVYKGYVPSAGTVALKRFDWFSGKEFTRNLFNRVFRHGRLAKPLQLGSSSRMVVLGVASALSFLHEECERQIIHRDVKTCNIMFDDDFNPKLGDFGLAQVYEHCCASRYDTSRDDRISGTGKRPTVKEAARIPKAEAEPPVLPSTRPTMSLRSRVFAECGDTLSLGGDNNANDDNQGG
ncbi:putative Mitochondrial carrier protein [Hibiscus syriacus]|uniref:Mitochondrial carrier protein n=1 Tax=Hibiscus syriacus TaxID=106335 RepID=A0A6A3AMC1_HIBSY|nr:putative Mitochondrial carrier protein [Hibiscus syriacus]